MKKTVKRILIGILILLTAYCVIGLALSDLVFPPEKVDYNTYFQQGDKLFSKFEGFDQTVVSVNDGWINSRLEIRPNSPGPPEHFHEHFEESFTVTSGTLSILVNGEKRTLRAGESLTVPPLTPHRPFNETGETVIVESPNAKSVPVEFGYHLSQLYGFMDRYENGPSVPQILMQLSVYGSNADTWLAEGPPLAVQKAMRILLRPAARLLGYRSYYEEYRPKRDGPR